MYAKFGDLNDARQVFDEMSRRNLVSWNSLIAGYVSSGEVVSACKLFDEMPERDELSYNSMIAGFAKAGDMDGAVRVFGEMPKRNVSSWNTMIHGYVDVGQLERARRIFDEMPRKDNISWTSMISGYAKFGLVDSACVLFNQVRMKDQFLWNSMIACYSKNGLPKEAIELFKHMLQVDVCVKPNEMIVASVVSACSQLVDSSFGSWIRDYCRQTGITMDDHLITAFVDMYAKCGNMDEAYEMFLKLHKRDVVSYSAMIFGFATHGKANISIRLFHEMLTESVKPNCVTFVGILTAYNHAGLVEQGLKCFHTMNTVYGVTPSIEHCSCIVDLLGRCGRIEEAYEIISSTRASNVNASLWGALLLACSVHGNVEFGEISARHCFELEPKIRGYYVLLSNIYACAGRWDNVNSIRKVMEEKGLFRIAGYSWIEVDGKLCQTGSSENE